MPNQQLLDYIKQKIDSGLTSENIKTIFVTNGWKEEEVDRALEMVKNGISGTPDEPTKSFVIPSQHKFSGGFWVALFVLILILAGAGAYWYGFDFSSLNTFISRIIPQ